MAIVLVVVSVSRGRLINRPVTAVPFSHAALSSIYISFTIFGNGNAILERQHGY
jgi:hypothetical protein